MVAASGAGAATGHAGAEELRFRGPSGRVYPGWKAVIGSTVGLTFGPSTMAVFCFGVFAQPLAQTFGWSNPAIFLGATIISIMIVLLTPLQGFLISRVSPRRLILLSIPLFAAAMASMCFLTGDIWRFYLAWIVIPICAIGLWPVGYVKLVGDWFDRRLGLALGITNAGIGIGAVMLPALVGWLVSAYGWREAYVGLGVLALSVWPVAFFLLKDRPETASTAERKVKVGEGMTLGEACLSRTFWVITAAFALLGVFSSMALVHQIKILIDSGLSLRTATLIQSAMGVALIIGRIGTGWLLDWIKASYVMATLVLGAGFACALYALGLGDRLALLCALLFGLVIGAEFDALGYIVPRYHGRSIFGQVYGIVFAVFQLASAASVFAIGEIREHYGAYAPALWALTLAMLACAGLFLLLGPYRFAPSKLDGAASSSPTLLGERVTEPV